MKPLISAFNCKLNLNPLEVNDPALQLGSITSNINETYKQEEAGEVFDEKDMISTGAYHSPAETDGEQLWPKITELDDRPPSPTCQSIAIKQVISERINEKLDDEDDRPQSPVDESKPTAEMMIRKPAYQSPKKEFDSEHSIMKPAYQSPKKEFDSEHSIMKNPKVHIVIREGAYQQASEGMLAGVDVLSLSSSSPNGIAKAAYQVSPPREPVHAATRESYRNCAQSRLSCVVEESESFSRREFGDDSMLNYMSTFSSAAHASYLSSLRAKDGAAFDYKKVSYRHNNYHHFTYNLSTSSDPNANFANSKSAPAGTATRTGSAFGLFRRGTSERSGLKMGRRPVYRGGRHLRKPKTLASTLLWPLLKIRNGYVGCMMGLEGQGDLTAMAQGGSYATAARYFADVPLSKSDSKNYG